MCLMQGHAPLQLRLPIGGHILLPPAWVACTSPDQEKWQPLQPCWLKGISICRSGGLHKLRCVGNGCHAEAPAPTEAACRRCCSGCLADAWLALVLAACLQTSPADLTSYPLCLLMPMPDEALHLAPGLQHAALEAWVVAGYCISAAPHFGNCKDLPKAVDRDNKEKLVLRSACAGLRYPVSHPPPD